MKANALGLQMMTVLAEKGLLQTKEAYSYTNQVLSNAPSLRPVRLDNLTTGQKEAHVMNKIL